MYTTNDLRREIVEALRQSGLKSFWANPDAPSLAVKAMGHVYVNLDHEPTDVERGWFEAALVNLERRQRHIGVAQ